MLSTLFPSLSLFCPPNNVKMDGEEKIRSKNESSYYSMNTSHKVADLSYDFLLCVQLLDLPRWLQFTTTIYDQNR